MESRNINSMIENKTTPIAMRLHLGGWSKSKENVHCGGSN